MNDQLGLFETYPNVPGWKGQETSHAAAVAVESKASTLRGRIMAILELNRKAYTADEVAEFLGETVLAVRPRFSELYAQGKIFDTGERRKNISGHAAIVWGAA